MERVLFVTWDGGGNVPPAVEIAREVAKGGGAPRFLGHEGQRAAIEAAGFPFEAYRHARPWSALTPRGAAAPLAYAAVFTDRGIGRDLIESLEREPADTLVIDGLLIGAMDAVRAEHEYLVLVHSLRDVMIRTLTTGPLALIMRLRGLDPAGIYASASGEIVAAQRSLDRGSDAAPAAARYVGPVIPAVDVPTAPEPTPVVIVSLSTTYIRGQREVLQKVLDTLEGRDVRVIVTTGPAVDASELRAPANAELHAFVPHRELVPRASLVIGHGGHATTMLALAHGVPLLIIPMNPSFDQPDLGRIVAEQGAGLTLGRRAGVPALGAAVDDLLASPDYRRNAERVGAEIRATRAARDAGRLILGHPTGD
jgi:UDP:flavonoid glycosyltransferase YjiC (YdhE family)